jgi:MFS family permease
LINPLQIATFRRFLLGRVLGVLGRQIVSITIGWEIYERTGSTWALGFVGLVQVLPVLFLAIPAGLIVDQRDRRLIAAFSQLAFAVMSSLLALQSQLEAPLWVLYLVLLGSGAIQAFSAPASSSLLPRLVPQEALGQANAWSSTVFNLAAISGPALGGFLIALTDGAVIPYLSGVAGSFIFSMSLFSLSLQPAPPASGPQEIKDWRAGVRFVFGSKLLLPALTRSCRSSPRMCSTSARAAWAGCGPRPRWEPS